MKRERKIFNSVREFDGQQETEKEREREGELFTIKRGNSRKLRAVKILRDLVEL